MGELKKCIIIQKIRGHGKREWEVGEQTQPMGKVTGVGKKVKNTTLSLVAWTSHKIIID